MAATTRFSATARAWRRTRKPRDGMMRFGLMRRVAFVVYRVHDLVQLLLPFAFLALAYWFATWLGALLDGAR